MTEKQSASEKTERRVIADRRRKPTPPISRYMFRGRRKAARRREEAKNYYVDRYEPHYLFVVLGVVVLCIADAFITLYLLQKGGIELNPVMAFLIQKDPLVFFLVKLAITSLGILFLLIHKNFEILGNVRVDWMIGAVFALYALLVIYELYLYFAHARAL